MIPFLLFALLAGDDAFEVRGNLLFNRHVYRAVAQIDEPPYDEADAQRAAENILRFLRESGYSLARVEARAEEGRLRLEVDEGRLVRVRLLGRDTAETVGLRLDLGLPQDVFNKLALEERLARIPVAKGEPAPSYEVREVEAQEGMVSLEALAWIPGASPIMLPSDARYELRVQLPPSVFGEGWRISADADSDGVLAGAGYRSRGLILNDDRWDASGLAGVNFFRSPDDASRDIAFSRAIAAGAYWLPNWFALRPRVSGSVDYVRRQRFDIGVPEYWWARSTGDLALSYGITEFAEVALAGGIQRRNADIQNQLDSSTTSELSEARFFAGIDAEVEFGIPADRPDRAHRLVARFNHFFPGDTGTFQRYSLRYQHVYPFRFDDLWVTAALDGVEGAYSEWDEPEIGSRFLRGVFGNQNYVQRIGAVGVAYRWSINRDIVKVGPYHDLATFLESDFQDETPRVRIANAFGIGVHVLLFDLFQLDVYTGTGFNSNGTNAYGSTFTLTKAF